MALALPGLTQGKACSRKLRVISQTLNFSTPYGLEACGHTHCRQGMRDNNKGGGGGKHRALCLEARRSPCASTRLFREGNIVNMKGRSQPPLGIKTRLY